MKGKKKYIEVFVILSVLIFLIGMVSAQEIIGDDSQYNFFDNLMYKLRQIGLFTAAGQARMCSVDSDYTIGPVITSTYYGTPTLLNSAGCDDVALFNVFDRDWHFKGEYRSEDVGGFQLSSITSTYSAIVEVYCCPYEACNSNSDCIAMEEGTNCNIAYGSCYGDIPSHSTKIYKCVGEEWVYQRIAVFGEDNFCMDITDNNYIDRLGGEHCRLSTYSSVDDGTWCGEEEPINGDMTCASQGGQCELYCESGKTNIGQYDCGIWKSCCKVDINGNGINGDENGEIETQTTLTKRDWEEAVVLESWDIILDSMCDLDIECSEKEDYEVECKKSTEIWDANYEAVKEKGCEGIVGWAKSLFVPIVGGFGWIPKIREFNCKIVDWFRDVKEDVPRGTCRASSETAICDFLEEAAFFDITGDKCTDGGIIIVGGLLLFVIIFSRLAGIYGVIKYEIVK